jgi:hypothetical protein
MTTARAQQLLFEWVQEENPKCAAVEESRVHLDQETAEAAIRLLAQAMLSIIETEARDE